MAKLNGYRLVNLTYNVKDNDSNSTNKILDQHFELDGEQSLMLLKNGGGKSVQVQMLLSPFVSPKHRDFGSRPFSDYFNDDKAPTYILVEWLLDNGEKVLTGLMVRKCKPQEVTEENKGLDIHAYIYEYSDASDEYSIANMPFAKRTPEGYIIASTQESIELFNSIQKKHKFAFKYFNLGSRHSRSSYYEKLSTYDIDRTEWEYIMKPINLSEGGLTELFKDCSNESKLLENWFLKTINSKLNKDVNTLDEIKKLFKKYLNSKQSKQHALDIVDGIEGYTQYANSILNINQEHKEALDIAESNKSNIKDIFSFGYKTNQNLKEQKNTCITSEQELKKELAMLKYKEASHKYYLAEDERISAEELLSTERKAHSILTKKLSDLERDDNLQSVIKINSEKRAREKDLEVLIAKREKENQSNEEIREKLSRVAYSLRVKLEKILDTKYDKYDELGSKKDNFNIELADINQDTGRIAATNKALQNDKEREQLTIKKLKPAVDVLLPKYDAPLIVNDQFFESLKINKNNLISDTKSHISSVNQQLETLLGDITNIEREIAELEKNDSICDVELKSLTNEYTQIQKRCDDITNIFEFLDLDTENIFDTTQAIKELDNRIVNVNQKIHSDITSKDKLLTKIEQLEKGVVIELPTEVKRMLKDLDISYELGLYYISKLNISLEQKKELLDKNPFLPFSIVINTSDIEVLSNNKLDISSSYTLYLANRDNISTPVKHYSNNGLHEVGDLKILYNFNTALLDVDEKDKMISKLKIDIDRLNDLVDTNNNYKESLESKRFTTRKFNISKLMVTNLEDKISELNRKKEQSKEIKNSKLLNLENIKSTTVPNLEVELTKHKGTLNTLLNELDEITKLATDFDLVHKATANLERIDKELNKNEELSLTHSKRVSEIGQLGRVLDKELAASLASIQETSSKIDEIRSLNLPLNEDGVLEDDIIKLEAQFKVLKEDSNKNIKDIQDEISKIDIEINSKAKEIEELTSLFGLDYSEYADKEYLIDNKIFITKSITQTKKDILRQQSKVEEMFEKAVQAKSRADKTLEDSKKECNNVKKIYAKYDSTIELQEEPIARELITETNFKELKNILQELITSSVQEKEDIEKKISIVNTSYQKLGFLSSIKDEIEDIGNRDLKYDLNLDNLVQLTEREIEAYKNIEKDINAIKLRLDKVFMQLSTEFKYRETAPYAKHIKNILEFKYEPNTVCTAINTTIDTLEKRRLQYESDLKLIDREHRVVVNIILKYTESIHNHMDSIDTNSSINLDDKRVKMLEIKQPEWDLLTATARTEGLINKLIEGCEQRQALGETSIQSADDFIATQIKTSKLYDSIVGISNVKITIKKLECVGNKTEVSTITWERAQKNSGGEGFATYFIILVSLLSYTKKRSSLNGDKTSESSKVIIMDNPFGKISSEHLLKPVMEIAKKYNTQLLCFTAQKGDNIYNEFNNIYHLSLESVRSSKTRVLSAEREVRGVEARKATLQAAQLRLHDIY